MSAQRRAEFILITNNVSWEKRVIIVIIVEVNLKVESKLMMLQKKVETEMNFHLNFSLSIILTLLKIHQLWMKMNEIWNEMKWNGKNKNFRRIFLSSFHVSYLRPLRFLVLICEANDKNSKKSVLN